MAMDRKESTQQQQQQVDAAAHDHAQKPSPSSSAPVVVEPDNNNGEVGNDSGIALAQDGSVERGNSVVADDSGVVSTPDDISARATDVEPEHTEAGKDDSAEKDKADADETKTKTKTEQEQEQEVKTEAAAPSNAPPLTGWRLAASVAPYTFALLARKEPGSRWAKKMEEKKDKSKRKRADDGGDEDAAAAECEDGRDEPKEKRCHKKRKLAKASGVRRPATTIITSFDGPVDGDGDSEMEEDEVESTTTGAQTTTADSATPTVTQPPSSPTNPGLASTSDMVSCSGSCACSGCCTCSECGSDDSDREADDLFDFSHLTDDPDAWYNCHWTLSTREELEEEEREAYREAEEFMKKNPKFYLF
ncbi:hypothetical protein F5Y17DRAFT_15749 [Xylariaceae sp. FL0594]|nr:hypothetical protein F5Y17DRAFT_15749 [Xylariaceae sp. FL0594]